MAAGPELKEAELAIQLLSGLSLLEAAGRRHISIATVRSQLAGLFRKAGTSNQGQLVAVLASLARQRLRLSATS